MSAPAAAAGGDAAAKAAAAAAATAARREKHSAETVCAHNATGVAVLKAALRSCEFLSGDVSIRVADSVVPYYDNSYKIEVNLLWPLVATPLAEAHAAVQALCNQVIAANQVAVEGDCRVNNANAVQTGQHVPLTSVSALQQFAFVKAPKKLKAKGEPEGYARYEATFTVGEAAVKLINKNKESEEKASSKKVGGGAKAALANAGEAVADAAASVVKGVKAAVAGVSAAVHSTSAVAAPAAAASSALSSVSASSAAKSSDYVVSTTQFVYRDLVLTSMARVLLLQGAGDGAPPSAALQQAASAMTVEQRKELLGGKEGIKELMAQRAAQGLPQLTADALLESFDGATLLSHAGSAARLVSLLSEAQLLSSLPADARALLDAQLLPPLEQELIMFANQAYTKGGAAVKKGKGTVPLAELL